jgi:hypothetical protein
MLVVLDEEGEVITLNGRGAVMMDEEGLVSIYYKARDIALFYIVQSELRLQK